MDEELGQRLTRIERKADAIGALLKLLIIVAGGMGLGWTLNIKAGWSEGIAYCAGYMAAVAYVAITWRANTTP